MTPPRCVSKRTDGTRTERKTHTVEQDPNKEDTVNTNNSTDDTAGHMRAPQVTGNDEGDTASVLRSPGITATDQDDTAGHRVAAVIADDEDKDDTSGHLRSPQMTGDDEDDTAGHVVRRD